MGVKYLENGQDFSFPSEFGFSGSASGRHDPRAHPVKPDPEYGDGLARGGQPKRMAVGGKNVVPGGRPPANATPTSSVVPTALAHQAALGALRLGTQMGARAARHPMGAAPTPTPPAAPPVPAVRTPVAGLPGAGPAPSMPGAPQLAKGGKFIQSGIKRPGRLRRLAQQHGVSLGEEIAKDKHSSDPSLRSAANLGARFRSGEFRHKGKKK